MIDSVAPGHDVTIEVGQLGEDTTFTAVCSCGHASAPSLCEADVQFSAHMHVPTVADHA